MRCPEIRYQHRFSFALVSLSVSVSGSVKQQGGPPPNEVWGKVIFSEACLSTRVSVRGGGQFLSREVSVQGGLCRGVSVHRGGLCPRGSPFRGVSVHRGVSVQGSLSSGSLSTEGVSVQGGLCPGESLSKVVSVHVGCLSRGVSVRGSLSTEGVSPQRGSLHRGAHCPGGLCLGESLSRGSLSRKGLCPGGLCPGWFLSRGFSIQGGLSRGSVREIPLLVNSGHYASYLNAFLSKIDICLLLV